MAEGGIQFDPSFLPKLEDQKPKRNLIASGLMTGLNEAASLEGSAIQLAGDLTGAQSVSDFGARAAAASSAAAQASGRPDLEVAPWRDGGASVLPWLAYQSLKQVPQLATYLAAGAAVPEAAVPAGLARIGAAVPRVLGGGGLGAGASFAARKAGLEAGKDFAKSVIGAEVAGIPFAAGSMYQEATSKPGGAAPGDAIKAAALSPFYAALDAVEPAQFKGLVSRGLEGNIVKRIATAGIAGAAMEVPQEGLQTALEQSFRTDLTPQQKMTNIVDAAITGGAVGGAFGGVGGIRSMKQVDPSTVGTDTIKGVVDEALGLPAPQVSVDSGGRAAFGSNGLNDLLATPVGEPPASDAIVASHIIPSGPEMIESQTIIQGKQGSLRHAKDYEQASPRPYAAAPQEELESYAQIMGNYLSAREGQDFNDRDQKVLDQYQQVVDELNHRSSVNSVATNDNIPSQVAGAVEHGSDVSGGLAATNSASPASATQPQDWTQQRDDLLKGVSTRRSYVDAGNLDEMRASLVGRLEAGSTAKGDIKLAERLGIDLNEPAKVAPAEPGVQAETGTATPVETQQSTNTAPAAPANQGGGDQSVDADFQAKWVERIKGAKDFGLKELRGVQRLLPDVPANEEQAKGAIYDALGAVDHEDTKVDGYKGVEQLAKEYDILDDEGRLTPEGVRIARTRLPLEDTVKEAVARGYNGTEASAFDKGARGERNVTLGSVAELKAYNDGQQWATDRRSKNSPIPATAGDTQTQGIVDKVNKTPHVVASAGVPEKQQNMQFLNQAVDKVYGSTLAKPEQARLKRMARQGATPEQLDEAARYMAAGFGAMLESGQAPKPYTGEVVTRGLINAKNLAARLQQETSDEVIQRQIQQSNSQKNKAAIEQKRYKDQLRSAINDAVQTGDINRRDQIALTAALTRNDFRAIEDRLSKAQQGVAPNRREFLAGAAAVAVGGIPTSARSAPVTVTQPSKAFRQQVMVGNITGALTAIKNGSRKSLYRLIAAKLLRGDWSHVRLNVVDNSDYMRGLTTLEDSGDSRIDIFGEDGLNEETVLHEMIHAYVQQRWSGISTYLPQNKELLHDTTDRGDKSIKDFMDLWRHIANTLQTMHPEIAQGDGVEVWEQNVWADPDEMLSWVLTNKDAQDWLRNVTIDGKQINNESTLWDRVINFFADILGLPHTKKTESALDHILSAGFAVLDTGANVKTGDFNVKMAQGIAAQRARHEAGMPMAERTLNTVGNEIAEDAGSSPDLAPVQNAQVKTVITNTIRKADELRDRDSIKGKVRKMTLGWMSVHGANEFYGDWFNRLSGDAKQIVANGVRAYEEALNVKNAIFARLSLMTTDVLDQFDRLSRENRNSADAINKVMQASQFGINPMRPWKEQSEALRTSKNAKNLEQLTNEYHNLYRTLLSRGHADVYHNLNRANDVQMLATMAMSLHQQVDAFERGAIPEFEAAPMDVYMDDQATKDFTPQQARDWWAGLVDRQVKAVYRHLDGLRAERDNPDTDAKTQEDLKSRIDPLGKRAKDISDTVAALNTAPYFHLGRYGDYIVSWRVADEEALSKVADALSDAGFDGVVTNGTERRDVFMRVENKVRWSNLHKLVQKLADEGIVDSSSIATRQRTTDDYTAGVDVQLYDNLIAGIEAMDLDEDTKRETIDGIKARMLDLAPELSITRVLTKRKSVPGFSADMMRSFAWRSQVGINALAGQSVAPKITQAFVDMRGALQDVEENSKNVPLNQISGMRDIVNEYSRRERERSMWPHSKLLDQLSGVATAWFLGFSVSYGFVNTTQLGVTLLPELGAKHGFANAFSAMAKATPVALKIMREVAKHGRSISLDRAMDAVITQDVLRKVVGNDMAEYLMRVVNTGNLDIGGPSRELVRAAQGRGDEHLDKILRYASSIGYYTETASRLIAAIATKQLNPQLSTEDAAERAAYVINETMWNYSQTNQGRQFGKAGVLGQYSPLALKFMQFQAQLTEKLVREAYNAIKGETKAERTEARRYLLGHMSAMTALAGSLGLPAATVFATVIDRLKDLWDDDDEPTNVRAAYRNWLADTFGVKAGEIISHGLFRGAGFDISQRIGEQDIVPFSKFLADRRDAKDSTKDLAFRTWGAPTSLIAGLVEGGQQIMSGDVSGGMTKMLPNAFAAPVKAYSLTQSGYTDASGKKLPMSAGATDVLVQLLGFNPSTKAEYSEARQDAAMRKGILTREASALRNQLADALTSGDDNTARSLIDQARAFDRANPAFAVLPSISQTIRRRQRTEEIARTIDAPMGVSQKDLEGQQLARYANY